MKNKRFDNFTLCFFMLAKNRSLWNFCKRGSTWRSHDDVGIFDDTLLVRSRHLFTTDEQSHLHRWPRHKRFEMVQTLVSSDHRGFSNLKYVC